MTKAVKYWILAIGIALLSLVEAISGFVLWLGFPAREGVGRGLGGGLGNLSFWELSKHTWIDIHDWVAVALVVLVSIHVILHWRWILQIAKSLFKGTPKRLIQVPVKTNE